MLIEAEFRSRAIDWLDRLVEAGVISIQKIVELEEALENMGQRGGRADVAIGIMCGWIIL